MIKVSSKYRIRDTQVLRALEDIQWDGRNGTQAVAAQVNSLKSQTHLFRISPYCAASNTPTINDYEVCRIETASLTTNVGASTDITLKSNLIKTNSVLLCSAMHGGSYTNGIPIVTKAVPSAGSAVITLTNVGAAALNGTVKFAITII